METIKLQKKEKLPKQNQANLYMIGYTYHQR